MVMTCHKNHSHPKFPRVKPLPLLGLPDSHPSTMPGKIP